MVKAGKRGGAPPVERVYEPDPPESCDPVLDDVDELIMSLDCEPAAKKKVVQEQDEVDYASPGVPEEPSSEGAVPWLDRYESTNSLITQLEQTLRMMEANGCNLTNAWELANTARSLLDSADVTQALIYANRSFRIAQDIHRFPDRSGVAAS
ncbi:MAG: hypothetical protein JSW25_06845 [Thermoplasmata archaeon]|nr:MAG: hypothetical protein JSW25_06845 [Thermoplasmata archaeon]